MLKRSSESSKRSWFHKVRTINHYLLCAFVVKWLSYRPCKFLKKYCFSIKLLHAHLQYVCNISAKCWKDSVKALRGVDFTKNVLPDQRIEPETIWIPDGCASDRATRLKVLMKTLDLWILQLLHSFSYTMKFTELNNPVIKNIFF